MCQACANETEVVTPAGHAAVLTKCVEGFHVKSASPDCPAFAYGDSPEDAMRRLDVGLASSLTPLADPVHP